VPYQAGAEPTANDASVQPIEGGAFLQFDAIVTP
jgi:hypothetical protein